MKYIFTFSLMLMAFVVVAQPTLPQPSPTATLEQRVGLTDVKITYSRPSVKGRVIFGDLVPYSKVWRTGANKATQLSLSTDATIGGKQVPAGNYSIFTIPGKSQWTIIIHKETELWGTSEYKAENDLVRFTVKPRLLSRSVESFTIDLGNFKDDGAQMSMMWDKTTVSWDIKVDVEAETWKNIETALADVGDNWRVYVRSAGYAADQGKRLEEALDWTNKALEMEEHWWTLWTQARVYAAMNDYKKAQKSLKKSIALGEEVEGWTYGDRLNKLMKDYKEKS